MLKILAIGNSFSQDATAPIESLTDDIFVRNACIGGCSLQVHCEKIHAGQTAYEYQHNGQVEGELVTLDYALCAEDWDWITVQQVSGFSGRQETYEPYLTELMAYVRARTKAKIAFHRTWAYECDCTWAAFADYENNTSLMWQRIREATESICRKHNLPIIDSGSMIAALRTYDFFCKESGGLGLCRDSAHLSYEYGRIAAACVWIKFFTGKIPKALFADDRPQGYEYIVRELQARQ